jgi:hypothetical protein
MIHGSKKSEVVTSENPGNRTKNWKALKQHRKMPNESIGPCGGSSTRDLNEPAREA